MLKKNKTLLVIGLLIFINICQIYTANKREATIYNYHQYVNNRIQLYIGRNYGAIIEINKDNDLFTLSEIYSNMNSLADLFMLDTIYYSKYGKQKLYYTESNAEILFRSYAKIIGDWIIEYEKNKTYITTQDIDNLLVDMKFIVDEFKIYSNNKTNKNDYGFIDLNDIIIKIKNNAKTEGIKDIILVKEL